MKPPLPLRLAAILLALLASTLAAEAWRPSRQKTLRALGRAKFSRCRISSGHDVHLFYCGVARPRAEHNSDRPLTRSKRAG